jgi:anti-sigma factor RsiW
MDHREALQLMATEKYLLHELSPEMREQFEEHMFGCRECALDVRMTSAFIQHSKKVLSTPEEATAPRPLPERPRRLGWLRPAFAVPLFAILLVALGYQVFVERPALQNTIADLQKPAVLSSAYLSSGMARGEKEPVVNAVAGQPFVLFVDVPADSRFASYLAEILGPAGAPIWSLNIPAEAIASARDTLPLRVASSTRDSGEYFLVVHGLGADNAQGPEVARYAFNLQLH